MLKIYTYKNTGLSITIYTPTFLRCVYFIIIIYNILIFKLLRIYKVY